MSNKHCPHCNCSTKAIKFGTTSAGRQRYRCKKCNRTWTSKSRPGRLEDKIWHDFVWNNMPVRALAEKYKKHQNTIRSIINYYQPKPIALDQLSQTEKDDIKVIILDTTYFGRKTGVICIIDAYTGKLLFFKFISGTETNMDYYNAVKTLFAANIRPKACVIDGRSGLATILEEELGMLVQMCHFHMWQIVRRYLTNNPVLIPNIELKQIMDWFINKHTQVTYKTFSNLIISWRVRNLLWLKEKHRNEHGKLEWSHAETRKAYNSLVRHSKWLFTYEKHPELNIPKTSNKIEGKFGNAKDKLRVHHGYTDTLKTKILFSLLSGE